MTLSVLLAMTLAAGSSGSPELCRGLKNDIEPDMRILESQLTQSAAARAAESLQDLIERDQLGGESQFGAFNSSKIIYGYILLRQAQADRKESGPNSVESEESARIFCNWLSSEGFWYD